MPDLRFLEAANAAEAVQILKCIPVDALFSDIDMPGRMDGLRVGAMGPSARAQCENYPDLRPGPAAGRGGGVRLVSLQALRQRRCRTSPAKRPSLGRAVVRRFPPRVTARDVGSLAERRSKAKPHWRRRRPEHDRRRDDGRTGRGAARSSSSSKGLLTSGAARNSTGNRRPFIVAGHEDEWNVCAP